jgi:hypothetical protein
MSPQVITPGNIIVGAAQIYNRDVGSVGAWTGVGATMDDTAVRIAQAWFRPDLNGMLGPVQELDYLTEQAVEAEFTMVEIAGSKLALAIPGATATPGSTTDASGTPGSTTLAAAAAIGDTSIKVAAVTNFAAGDYVRIGTGGAAEYRQIDVVGTAGVGGTGLQFRDALQKAHASGDAVVETVGDGKTVITGSTVRRMPASAYKQWAIVGEAPNGYYELLLDSGISVTDAAEITFGDEAVGGVRTTIQSRYAGATPNTPPWRLRVPA